MNCPYCGGEMKKGELRGDRYGINWFPNNGKKKFGIFPDKMKITGVFDCKIDCYYCDNCNKMIFDVLDKKEQN